MADPKNIPLVVDLDGTLIRSDMMWESLARLLRRNPLAIFQILFWWTRGRALLKQKLAARVTVNPDNLALNEYFLVWLRDEKAQGRKIILATASDLKMAQPIAARVGLFDEVLGSDGKTNLRSENKLRALTEKFGERGFDYAGNSSADFTVWRGSRQAVVVNASPAVLREAANCTTLGPTFCENFSHLTVAKSVCTELFLRSGYLLAILSGLLLALAFPKTSFAGFAWIAPALLMFATKDKSGADAFRVGYVSGITFWLASLYWLLLIPYAFFPILGWLALAGYIALYTGAWTWLITRHSSLVTSTWATRVAWSLAGAAAWVALEMVRVRLFSGFPWSLLGVSQYKLTPLIQISAITGVYGVSFLVVWFSLALYSAAQMIFHNPSKRHVWQAEIIFPLVVVIACFTGGMFHMNHAERGEKSLRVTMIQPAIPQTVIWNPASDEDVFKKFLALNEAALTNQTDLLIWPESAVPVMNEENCRALSELAARHHVWLVLNGEDLTVSPTATNYYNAAFLVNPQGLLAGTYHKQKLVIFGEYVPLVNWLPFLKWLTPIVGGWSAGETNVAFEIKRWGEATDEPTTLSLANDGSRGRSPHQSLKVAPLICFEDTFATTTRGMSQNDVDFLINLTNDGWFGDSSEQWQHMANSVFRCVENGLPLLRCCNNGITCVINAHGRVETIFRDTNGSEYKSGVLRVELPLLTPEQKPAATFYNRHGDWFGWGCVAATVILLSRKPITRGSNS